jgi:NADH-quinone oxidoreductase subunit J
MGIVTIMFAVAPTADLWLIALPVVVGLAAVYLLLPRPRGYHTVYGAALGALALLLAGLILTRAGAFTPETFLFYAFSAIAIVSGVLLITQWHPARAALSFALVVLSTCGLFLLQAAPFLMAATTIIYAGAIIVTFLFVLMLAQQAGWTDADHRSREPFLATLAGFLLLGALLYVLYLGYDTRHLDDLLDRTARAAGQESIQAMHETLGDQRDFLDGLRQEAQRFRGTPADGRFETAVENVAEFWNDPAKLRESLGALHAVGVQVRDNVGSLQPDPGSRVSAFSGAPANAPPDQLPRDAQGRVAMPAENVGYLGRSLFTDYLLPVELAGTLLLVATIGAIAIASRRAEVLR